MNRKGSSKRIVPAAGFFFLSVLAAQEICLSKVSMGFTPQKALHRPQNAANALDVMTTTVKSTATVVQDVVQDLQETQDYVIAPPPPPPSSRVTTRTSSSSSTETTVRQLQRGKKNAVRDPNTPACIEEVASLADFRLLEKQVEGMVVVRFYSPYCRACKAMEQPFYRMANQYTEQEQNVKFVQVRITKENADFHERMGIATLPFIQLYNDANLVEQLRVPKSQFQNFARILHTYLVGECELIEYHDEEIRFPQPYDLLSLELRP